MDFLNCGVDADGGFIPKLVRSFSYFDRLEASISLSTPGKSFPSCSRAKGMFLAGHARISPMDTGVDKNMTCFWLNCVRRLQVRRCFAVR